MFILTAHPDLEEPHFTCLVAACGQWLSTWTAGWLVQLASFVVLDQLLILLGPQCSLSPR